MNAASGASGPGLPESPMYRYKEIEAALTSIPDPIALLKGLFADSPVGFQIHRADGHSLLTNRAFRELFGSEPPPAYNIFKDETHQQQGLMPLVRRAFQGETITTPTLWYDPRDLKHVRVIEGRRVAVSATIFPIFDNARRVAYVAITFKDWTAEIQAREEAEAARDRAEAAKRRVEFLANASSALSESLDLNVSLTRVAQLAVPAIADWCTVVLADQHGVLQRIAVVHRDPEKLRLTQEYKTRFPPSQHKAPEFLAVLETGMPVLTEHVDRDLLRRAAQNEDHVRVLEELGVASSIMVALRSPNKKPMGVLSFVLSDETRTYAEEDVALAKDLSSRVVLAIENARLYQAEQAARAVAQKQRDELAVVASDSRAAEEQLRRQAALLEEAVQSRDTFLSVASHELKTPLTPMALRLQALVRAADAQPPSPFLKQVRAYTETASKQIRRLTSLVDELLDVSRIAAGKLDLEREDIDLAVVVREVAARFEAQAARAGSTLSLELPEFLALHLDKLRLEQVISNMLDNAIKYGPGKPIQISLRREQGKVVLAVKDQGIGIAPDQRERIFERFERAVSGRNYGGLGLGLYITRTIVQAMGGQIRVASELGNGATFTVELPVT